MTTLILLLTLSQVDRSNHLIMSGFIGKEPSDETVWTVPAKTDAFTIATDGARIDFGTGASDYIAEVDDGDCRFSVGNPVVGPTMCLDDILRQQYRLQHEVERNAIRLEAQRDHLWSALAGFSAFVMVMFVVLENLRRRDTKALHTRLDSLRSWLSKFVQGCEENRRSVHTSLTKLLADKLEREGRDQSAEELRDWLVVNRAYNPKYECFDHGSCKLPPGHGAGQTEVVHEDHVGHRWVTRHNVFNPSED